VISNLININKTDGPNNSSFNMGGIISSLTGGGAQDGGSGGFNLGGLVSKFTSGGLDANDGHIGLDDIISKVMGGAQQSQQAQSGGGGCLVDMIKGFMK
jgi:hypothetical protein